MGQFIDLTGQQFGMLTAASRAGSDKHGATWNCVCKCGKRLVVRANSLRTGNTRSCGVCLHVTHGGSRSRLHRIWRGMRARCSDPKHDSYSNYGALGIGVCGEWENYALFQEWAYTNGYAEHLSIDRIDGRESYSPGNCRWVTQKDQQHNIKSNVIINARGKAMTIAEWALFTGVPYSTIWGRIRNGWEPEEALACKRFKRGERIHLIDDKARRREYRAEGGSE